MRTFPEEAKALHAVSAGETTALLADLVRIDSTHSEDAIAERLIKTFEVEGIDYRVVPGPTGHVNVLAHVGQNGLERPRLLYSAHMDATPVGARRNWTKDPYGALIDGGRLYGRGASDDKGGLAAMTMSLVALRRSQIPLDRGLLLTAVSRETDGNAGTRELAKLGLTADFAVVGEYSEATRIAVAYRGALWASFSAYGRTAHTGRPGLGADAIAATLDELVPRLRQYPFELYQHDLLRRPEVTVTQIRGGHSKSSLAEECDITVDARFLPGESVDRVWAGLRDRARDVQLALTGIECTAELIYGVNGFETSWDDRGVTMLANSITDVCGTSPKPMGKVGMCDGNILADWLNIPTVAYGPGNPSGMGPDEYCDIELLELSRRAYTLFGLRMARTQN